MNRFKNLTATLLILSLVVVPMLGCVTDGTATYPSTVTTKDSLLDGTSVIALNPDGTYTVPEDETAQALEVDMTNPPKAIPKEIIEALKLKWPTESTLMFTQEQFVKPEAERVNFSVPVDEDGKVNWGTLAGNVIGLVTPMIPGGAVYGPLAIWLASLFVGSRSRKHLLAAGAALSPVNGKTGSVDFTGALVSLTRAAGLRHTSDSPAELRARADKLEAANKAKIEDLTVKLNGPIPVATGNGPLGN